MTRGRSQRWIPDTLLDLGGWGVLHPKAQGFFEELVYNHADATRALATFELAKAPKEFWDNRAFLGRDAHVQVGSGAPPWWNPQ